MEHNMSQNEFALDIRGLSVEYRTDEGTVKALNGLNLSIKKGTSLGLVGETGAGNNDRAFNPEADPRPAWQDCQRKY